MFNRRYRALILHYLNAHFKRKKQVLEDPFLSNTKSQLTSLDHAQTRVARWLYGRFLIDINIYGLASCRD